MKMMKGARKGRDVGEGAERTGGEGGGDVVGAMWVMGKNFVVMLGMVLGGDVEEGGGRIMEIGIVLSYPLRGEETMFGGYVMTEGVSEKCGGVGGDRVVEMIEGILEVEDGGMWDMRGLDGVK